MASAPGTGVIPPTGSGRSSRASSAPDRVSSRSRDSSQGDQPNIWDDLRADLGPDHREALDRLMAEPLGRALVERRRVEAGEQSSRTKPNRPSRMEDKIISRLFLQDEGIVNSIRSPLRFEPQDVIPLAGKAFAARYRAAWDKPFRKNFNGKKKDLATGAPTARYFLRRLNAAQEDCPLSEKEFRTHLVRQTEEPAWDRISTWVEAGIGTQELYNRILNSYDTQLSPEEAERQLREFSSKNHGSWAEVEAEVEKLAKRACLERMSKTGEGQKVLFDHLVTKHLQRLMPEPVRDQFEAQMRLFCNATGKEIGFDDFISLSGKFRTAIDRHMQGSKKGKGWGSIHVVEGQEGPVKARPKRDKKVEEVRSYQGPKKPFVAEARNGRGYEDNTRKKECIKCRKRDHHTNECPLYPGPPSKYLCKNCHLEAYHPENLCPLKLRELQVKEERSGGKPKGNNGGDKRAKN